MTINERIKMLRKEMKSNQKHFANVLGVTQSGVSYIEQEGNTVSESTIKVICSVCGIREEWLRNGSGPMRAEPETFSLDQFVKDHGATGLELEIVKAYFELDPEIRQAVLDHFKARFSAQAAADPAAMVPDTPEELEAQYPPVGAGGASGVDAG